MSEEKFIPDTGCELHPACLACPEPICGYDYPGGMKAYIKHKELLDILNSGCTNVVNAESLGIHKRTFERRKKRELERAMS